MAMFSEPYCSVVNVGGGGRGEGGGEVEAWVYKKQLKHFFKYKKSWASWDKFI